jgi:hypothetical protein
MTIKSRAQPHHLGLSSNSQGFAMVPIKVRVATTGSSRRFNRIAKCFRFAAPVMFRAQSEAVRNIYVPGVHFIHYREGRLE